MKQQLDPISLCALEQPIFACVCTRSNLTTYLNAPVLAKHFVHSLDFRHPVTREPLHPLQIKQLRAVLGEPPLPVPEIIQAMQTASKNKRRQEEDTGVVDYFVSNLHEMVDTGIELATNPTFCLIQQLVLLRPWVCGVAALMSRLASFLRHSTCDFDPPSVSRALLRRVQDAEASQSVENPMSVFVAAKMRRVLTGIMPGDGPLPAQPGLSASARVAKTLFPKTLGQKAVATLDGNARDACIDCIEVGTIRCMAALFSSPWSLRVEEPQTISGPELINILTTPLDQTSQPSRQSSPHSSTQVSPQVFGTQASPQVFGTQVFAEQPNLPPAGQPNLPPAGQPNLPPAGQPLPPSPPPPPPPPSSPSFSW